MGWEARKLIDEDGHPIRTFDRDVRETNMSSLDRSGVAVTKYFTRARTLPTPPCTPPKNFAITTRRQTIYSLPTNTTARVRLINFFRVTHLFGAVVFTASEMQDHDS